MSFKKKLQMYLTIYFTNLKGMIKKCEEKINCILVVIYLKLLQNKLVSKYLSYKASNLKTLSLCFSSAKGVFRP